MGLRNLQISYPKIQDRPIAAWPRSPHYAVRWQAMSGEDHEKVHEAPQTSWAPQRGLPFHRPQQAVEETQLSQAPQALPQESGLLTTAE